MKKQFTILVFSLLLCITASAQVPTVQDCLGAIPVCQDIFVQPNAFSGTGNYLNEITPALSCLNSGEKNDVWYVFTVQNPGWLNFTIYTVNPADDYDWALFNLTNATCQDIPTNPSLEVSCNFSGVQGNTGANGLPGAQNNPQISVAAGETYVLNISNFTSNQNGYTLDFTASTAVIYDTIPPTLDSVSALACPVDSMVITFSENVQCNSVQKTDFTFTDPGGNPITISNVTSPNCISGADNSNTYTVFFTPALSLSGNYTFSLVDTVLDACGNVGIFPASIVVTVAGSTLVLNSTDVLCPGGSSGTGTVTNVIGGSGPFTYLWSNGQTTAIANNLGTGTYTVTVTPSSGCPAADTVNINAPTTFNVVPNTSNAVCGQANGSAWVTVTGATSPYGYTWSNGAPNSATANGLSAATYTVTVTDAHGCTITQTFTVGSTAGVVASIQSSTNVTCYGGSNGSATVGTASGSGNYSYQWSNAGNTNPYNNFSIGTYTCTVTDINTGCTSTTTVVITQPAAPVAVNVVSTTTNCGQSNGTATATGSNGVAPYTYSWSNAATGSNITGLAQGTYTVTASDNNGCTATGTVQVNASNAPVLSVNASGDVSCHGGSNGSANVGCVGCNGVSVYAWSNGAAGSSVNTFQAGTFTCTVTDASGCTATVSVTINEPAAVVITSIPNDTICIGQAATINPVVNGGTPGYSYLWNTGAITGSINVNPVSGTTYTVTVTDSHNCTSSQTAIIIVHAALSVTVSNDTTICSGSQVTINAGASGGDNNFTFNWNNGMAFGNSITLSPTGDTTLNVVVTDGCGTPSANATVNIYVTTIVASIINILDVKCFGGNDGSATMNLISGGTAPLAYSWSNGNASATANNLAAGTYTATITDNSGCTVTSTVVINQPTQLATVVIANPTICIGENTNLTIGGNGGTPGYNYSWSTGSVNTSINVSPVITTQYVVTVTDANNCTVSSVYTVIVNPPLTISAITPNSTICNGDTMTVSITMSGGNNVYFYNWSNGAATSSFAAFPDSTITYYVTVHDGCTTPSVSDSVVVIVEDVPIVDFTYSPDHGCQPLIVSFNDSSQTISGSTYQWLFGDGGSSSTKDPMYQYNGYGLFDVTLIVTTPQGCKTELTKPAIIDVYAQPIAGFNYTPNKPTLYNPTVEFTDKTSGNPIKWTWDFGDSTAFSNLQNPIHTYQDTGTYIVMLAVENADGCVDTLYYILIVEDLYSFYIPNSFTPNGDGKNDYFIVKGLNYNNFEVYIYNRWGNLIHTAVQNPVWDGIDDYGLPVEQGAYYYLIKVYEDSGKKHEYRGAITLYK